MKYSFMSFSCPELTFQGMLDAARQYRYDGIEPRMLRKHAHGVELESSSDKRQSIRKQAEESGIDICCVATSCRYADPDSSAENVEQTLRAIDLAADIGSPRLRVFGGTMGKDLSRDDAVKLVAESLSLCADRAAVRDVTICVETHDDWCHPSDVVAVMKAADHPNIAVNWDIMHPVQQEFATMSESYEMLKPWIKHVHFHDGATIDGKNHLVPVGEGNIDHKTALKALADESWDGYMSGEWIGWTPWEAHLPVEIQTMKNYEKTL